MKNMKNIIFEHDKKIGFIILNRPKQRNALSLELMDELDNILDKISDNRDIHVLVIKGKGPAFCAGHNINELVGEKYNINHFRNIFYKCSKIMQKIHKIPQPVIAQVHGAALAAGCQLVAACDLAIADEKTKFSTPGVKIGLFCSTPMVPLTRVIGRRNALDMLLTGRFISASEALKFGLINKMVNTRILNSETQKYAEDIAQYSLKVLEYGKKNFYKQIEMEEKKAYDIAKEAIAKNCLFKDAQEGMKAFLEKRKPIWTDQ